MIIVQAGEPLSLDIPPLDALDVPVAITSAWSARVQVRPDRRSTVILHEWTTTGAVLSSFLWRMQHKNVRR